MIDILPTRDIVLLGAGHTNIHVLRMWRMHRIADVRLTCVSDHPIATYSGMLSGTLAGQYTPSDMQIDLVQLCASCGVRFVHARATGLNVGEKQLLLEDRSPVDYDLLSIGIGSQPSIPSGVRGGLSIKPMQTFVERLGKRVTEVTKHKQTAPLRVAVVGGGAAGVEISLCLRELLRRDYPELNSIELVLVESSSQILGGMSTRVRQLAIKALTRSEIEIRTDARVSANESDAVELHKFDIVVWATSARPPDVLASFDLPLDARGFLETHSTLQSTASDDIFVVGDTGAVQGEAYDKAGVFAVRQGPILWENLRRKLRGQPLRTWRPQSKFLALLNTGDGRAILSYPPLGLHSRWAMRLKNYIDIKFISKYQS